MRLDEATLDALRTPLSDPLARAVSWTALWDMTRDGELPSRDYIDLVLAGLSVETDMAATSTLLNQARTAASAYTAPELRDDLNRHLVAGLARLLRDSESGSDKQVLLAKALIASANSDEAVTLIGGWLAGEEVPAGLKIDTAMRWAIVKSLASLGKISADDIEREKAEHDDTSAGAEQAAGAMRRNLPGSGPPRSRTSRMRRTVRYARGSGSTAKTSITPTATSSCWVRCRTVLVRGRSAVMRPSLPR